MAHVTDLGFTAQDLNYAIATGEVRVQTHPEFPELAIYNYTEETQFRKRWNKVTLACRGLIINTVTREVVARPWEKFFNFGEMNNRIDSYAPVEVTDKLDGSLGILYRQPDGKLAIATRGSFASDQAVEANKIWSESYSHLDIPNDYTFLFEILVPWNRIVVSYNYDDEYLQQGRGVLPQGSSRNDTGEHLYPTEDRLEGVSSVQERGSAQRQGEAFGEAQGERAQLAFSEQAKGQRAQGSTLCEDSSGNLGSQERQALRGLSTDVSSGVHGFRPPTGNREEIQYRSGKESAPTTNGNGEVRTGVRELSQNQDIHYTPGNLVLLGAVHKERGWYIGPTEAESLLGWTGPVTEVFHAKDFVSSLSLPDRAGKEGYVIRSGRNIVKMKQADYVELHRIVTNLSPKTIWTSLKEGKTIAEICDGIPDEFHAYVEEHGNKILADFTDIKIRTKVAFERITTTLPEGFTRKQFALRASNHNNPGLLFALLDDRPIDEVVWKLVKPVSDKTLITDEEE